MKAHDVRRLKVCGVCGDLGTYHAPNGGHAIIKSPAGRFLHPHCMSRDLLLKCETAELVYISIADVGMELFEVLIAELMRRRHAERIQL